MNLDDAHDGPQYHEEYWRSCAQKCSILRVKVNKGQQLCQKESNGKNLIRTVALGNDYSMKLW